MIRPVFPLAIFASLAGCSKKHNADVRIAIGREPSGATAVLTWHYGQNEEFLAQIKASNQAKACAVEMFKDKRGDIPLLSTLNGVEGGSIHRFLLVDSGRAWLIDDDRRNSAGGDPAPWKVRKRAIKCLKLGVLPDGTAYDQSFTSVEGPTDTKDALVIKYALDDRTGGGFF